MKTTAKIYLTDSEHNNYPSAECCTVMHYSYAHGKLQRISGYDIILGNIDAVFLLSQIGEHRCTAIDVQGNEYDAVLLVCYDKSSKQTRGLVCLNLDEELEPTREAIKTCAETGIL